MCLKPKGLVCGPGFEFFFFTVVPCETSLCTRVPINNARIDLRSDSVSVFFRRDVKWNEIPVEWKCITNDRTPVLPVCSHLKAQT